MENQNPAHFFVLNINGIPRSSEDELTDLLLELGATGFSEKLPFTQDYDAYTVDFHPKDPFDLEAFFESEIDSSLIESSIQGLGVKDFSIVKKQNEDWQESWKKGFEAFCLVDEFWVVPTWLKPPTEAKSPLFIDPGLAFGTGTHDTTQLAAKVLVDLFRNRERAFPKLKPKTVETVIDVGTGTGILSILLKRLGNHKIVATEIDKMAALTARENLAKNDCPEISVFDCDLDKIEGPFDLLVANIIDGVLTRLQDDFERILAPGGIALLTGILEEREPLYLDRLVWRYKLVEIARVQKGEWVGYLYQRATN